MKILDEHKEHLFWMGEKYIQVLTTVTAHFSRRTGVLVVDCEGRFNSVNDSAMLIQVVFDDFVKNKRYLESTGLNQAVRKAVEYADTWHKEHHEVVLKNGYVIVPGKEHYLAMIMARGNGNV